MTPWREPVIRTFSPNWPLIGFLGFCVGGWAVSFWLALSLFHWAGRVL